MVLYKSAIIWSWYGVEKDWTWPPTYLTLGKLIVQYLGMVSKESLVLRRGNQHF